MFEAKKESNELLIMGDIGESFWDETSVGALQVVDALAEMSGDEITVRINSYGGSVADGLAIFSALKRHPAKIIASVEGYAYSIASLIAMAGDIIKMPPNALMMIHGPSTYTYGTARKHLEAAEALATHATAMESTYLRNDRVLQADVREWLADGADHYFTAEKAHEAGLIDQIGEELQIAATHKLAYLRSKPSTGDKQVMTTKDEPKTEIIAAERKRIQLIHEAFSMPAVAGISAEERGRLSKQAVDEGWEPSRLHTALLELLPGAEPAAGPADAGGLTSGQVAGVKGGDELDKMARGMQEQIVFRAGLDRRPDAQKQAVKSEYMGMSLVEMARRNLERHNVRVVGMNRDQIIRRALSFRADAAISHTTSDFPAILENTLNKAVLLGWSETDETWRLIARVGNLPDFRPATRSDIGEYPTLPEIPEGGSYKYVTLSDRKETIVLLTYGSAVGITRQAIVNDDLDMFSRIGVKQGRAASRRVGDLVYMVLTSNPVMQQDGKTLFHADHNNQASIKAAPSVTTLDEARRLMALQKDQDSHAHGLGLPLERVIVPVSLQTVAEVLREAADNPDNVGGRDPNPFRRTFQVAADPRLDANSQVKWYTSCDPNRFDVIEAGFLEGQTEPYLESRQGWTIDGMEAKVRIDAAAIPLDFRTMVENDGA